MPLNRAVRRKRFKELVLRRYPPRTTEVQVSNESNVAVENVPTTSIAADNVMSPTAVSSETTVHVPIVGSSQTLSGLNVALEPVSSISDDDLQTQAIGNINSELDSTADDVISLMTPTAVSSDATVVHVPIDADVGSSQTHSELTVPLESVTSITDDANSRSDVAVTPDLSTVEGLQTPVVSNAGVSRLSKAKQAQGKAR